MPRQETFFDEQSGDLSIRVIKTYDPVVAREAFDQIGEAAESHLWEALGIDNLYNLTEVPALNSLERHDFLWDEVLDAAREDGNLCSFFVVEESCGPAVQSIYVSPDWPSAEAFAKGRIQTVT
jgi:hypothetical protein